MSLYSLLAVASFAPLAFGGDNDDNPSKYEPSGQAYRYDPYERTYGKAYSRGYDPYWQTYGYAHSMHKDGDDQHYDDDNYRSSKQWQRPSKDSKDWKKSADWKKDSYEPNGHAYKYDPYKRTYGRAYRYDPYERTYGHAYSNGDPYRRCRQRPCPWSMTPYGPKDDIVTEPKVTLPSKGNWKKSDYSTTKDSEPSRTWKKDDGKYGSKYQPKKKYPSKDKPKYKEPKDDKHYPSKDEPNDHKIKPSKDDHEPVDYDHKDDDDGDDHGVAYSFGGVGAPCTRRSQCTTGCCEGPSGQGKCVAKKIDWTTIFAYCPAECVGYIGGRPGTC